MIHFNLGSHDGRTIEELTSLVEATERAAFTTKIPVGKSEERNSVCELPEAKPALPELPRFDPAYDAGVEMFQGQFGGEEQ